MRNELLDHLACPSCGGDFSLHADNVDGDHVISGTLTCDDCGRVYAVVGGVPRLNTEMGGLERVAQTFGYEWKQHHAGRLEDETVFGLTREQDWAYFVEATGLDADDLRGDVVLDAGCGSGRLTSQMAESGARAAIGMDINEAVDEAFAAWRHLPNLHVVQGNVFAPPFKERNFDLVWSNGVIHHTPDAEGAHRSLTSLVKPGGVLYVWVYAKRFNPFRFTKDVLDALRVTKLPEPVLLRVANGFAYVSIGMLRGYQLVRKLPGLEPETTHARRTVRNRTVDELKLTWFDALSPEYDSRHSEAEVIGWFENAGFREIHAIEEPKVGVRGVAPQATS
jgi:SAM-dependent methyltransferase